MKKVITLLSLTIYVSLYSQTSYQNGFSAGYKAGYCYNVFGCISPIAPIGQLDIKQDYQTGYNNGFVKGQQDQVSKNTSYSSTGGAKGELRPSTSEYDLSNDPQIMVEMWANYYAKRRIKKQQTAKSKK